MGRSWWRGVAPLLWVSMLSVLPGARAAAQQQAGADSTEADGGWASLSGVRAWYALAYHAPLRTRLGTTGERNLSILGMQFVWSTQAGRNVTLSYTVDLLPAVVATQNPAYRIKTIRFDSGGFVFLVPLRYRVGGYTAYGAGIAPLGFAATFGRP